MGLDKDSVKSQDSKIKFQIWSETRI